MRAFVPGLILGFVVGAVVGVVAPEFRSTPRGVPGTDERAPAQPGEREREMLDRTEDVLDDAEEALDGLRPENVGRP